MNTQDILYIVGAGGHGRAVAEAALENGWENIRFIDDSYQDGKQVDGWPVVGSTSHLPELIQPNDCAIVAIGNQHTRAALVQRLSELQASLTTIIHPRAYVSPSARLGSGVAIMAGAIVGAHAQVGQGCIVNANATVDHDAILHDFAHLGVGTQLAGGVIIETMAWLQAGCAAGYHVVVKEGRVIPPGTALLPVEALE
ncbi:NeuD/PglB/VioB family sugar acetyltransferase [Alcaligenes aquatilis]|uniref:Acetyltransferase n=1 Tax=Alcaligenes aquatilis TaxID=323284 RepID=A0A3G2HYJ2_9BURK|nr:NeuD/PglB/VioB family sugar acetyltransferase [Alcaligenes aquatilis]AYN22222.1 acetyltransferase [Alcaligenes aquatilis]